MRISEPEKPKPIGLSCVTEHWGFQALGNAVIGLAFTLAVIGSYPIAVENYERQLRLLNSVVVWLFTVELCFNIGAHGRKPLRFFLSGWNWFDFIIVGASVPFEFLPAAGGGVAAIRVLRVLRVLRGLRIWKALQDVVEMVLGSMPAIAPLVLVTLLILSVLALMGIAVFGPDTAAKDVEHFGNFHLALISTFLSAIGVELAQLLRVHMVYQPFIAPLFYVLVFLVGLILLLGVIVGMMATIAEERRTRRQQTQGSSNQGNGGGVVFVPVYYPVYYRRRNRSRGRVN